MYIISSCNFPIALIKFSAVPICPNSNNIRVPAAYAKMLPKELAKCT